MPGDLVRDNQLRVRERVHQEHFAAVGERDTNVEHRLLHMFETYRWKAGMNASGWDSGPRSDPYLNLQLCIEQLPFHETFTQFLLA